MVQFYIASEMEGILISDNHCKINFMDYQWIMSGLSVCKWVFFHCPSHPGRIEGLRGGLRWRSVWCSELCIWRDWAREIQGMATQLAILEDFGWFWWIIRIPDNWRFWTIVLMSKSVYIYIYSAVVHFGPAISVGCPPSISNRAGHSTANISRYCPNQTWS